MANKTGKLSSIQLLRAIAIILVIHCHILDFQLEINSNTYQSHFFYLQNFGAIGVDLFFVISGFIITIVSVKYAQSSDAINFFLKRIIRVVPLYWLVSLLYAIRLFIKTGYWPDIRSIIATIGILPTTPIIFLGWTLSFEMLFYVVITITIIVNNKKYILYSSLLILILVTFNYVARIHFYPVNFLGNGIMLEFLMGVIAGRLYLSKMLFSHLSCIIFIVVAVLGILFMLVNGFGEISEMGNVISGRLSMERSLIWGVPCALLVAGLTMLEKLKRLRIPPFWMAVGNASFSLYLIHLILLDTLYYVCREINLHKFIQGDILAVIIMLITLAAGWFFYKWIELPLLTRLNSIKDKYYFGRSRF